MAAEKVQKNSLRKKRSRIVLGKKGVLRPYNYTDTKSSFEI